jgi:hypothetical protein
MIKIEEIRIGNLVKTNQGVFRVLEIESTSPKLCLIPFLSKEVHWRNIEDVSPVVFDRAMAEKLGFQQEGSEAGDDGAMELGNSAMEKDLTFLWIPKPGRYMDKDSVGLWINSDFGNEQCKVDIKRARYVHQIQNIYFALKGKELKYKI